MEKTAAESPCHVILIPYPSQGHINPLLQFAKRLASKAVRTTLAATHYTAASIYAPGVAVCPISDGFDRAGFSEARNCSAYLDSFRAHGSRTLSELIEGADHPVTCVVYDAFLPWALDVARAHGVHGAAFFTNSAAVSAVFGHVHGGTLKLPPDVGEGRKIMLPGLPPLGLEDLPGFIREPESYPAYLAMKLSQFSNLDEADFVFCNSFEELEGQEAKSVGNIWPAKLIGPMVPSSYLDGRIQGDKGYGASLWKPLNKECSSWLETKPLKSVIYVSFGSMVSLTTKQTHELACALAHSASHFLWVVRDTEREKLPPEFSNSTKDKGLIVSWCNQLETLAHPSIGCFVSHCGWNSTLEGLSLRVPMVGMPQWADQMTDARFIEVWGIGVRAREDKHGVVTRDELLSCLNQVMGCEEIRGNVRRWSDLAKRACDEGGSSDRAIHDFVDHLKKNQNRL
ncbi:UDP-glycosyltransferase 74B1 [Striga hermonthica]|uniref:anthocyanidin 3-O-glucoside 5-O-glucosyltransferase n=1 Tax=Striga hermonthica TaxID=68872 RepID=A0A9N7NST1_STRHE|nr:UDP-glycosyltransferase 74B1 [Striga hermonthica]